MSIQRSTASVTWPSVGAVAGSVDGTTPSATVWPASSASASLVVVAGRELRRGRRRARGRRRRGAGRAACPAAHECTHGSAPASAIASSTQPSASEASGGCTVRCRPKPDAVGTAPASTAVSAGSSTWTTSRCRAGHPAAYVGDVVAEPLGQRLRQLAAGAEVGEHLVAARPLDGRGQRPRSGDLDLERAGVPCACSSSAVEVLREQAAGPAVVDARGASVSRQPAGCRSAPSSAITASARPVIVAVGPRPGTSGR